MIDNKRLAFVTLVNGAGVRLDGSEHARIRSWQRQQNKGSTSGRWVGEWGGEVREEIRSILIPHICCGGIAGHSSSAGWSLGERAHYWEFNYLWRRGCVWHVIWCGDQRHIAHQPPGRRLVTDARRPLCPFILIEPALIT
jgi:hypothetical protein